jgi:hypothetical protein
MGWDGRWHQGSGNRTRQWDAEADRQISPQMINLVAGIFDQKKPSRPNLSLQNSEGVCFYAWSTLVHHGANLKCLKRPPLSEALRGARAADRDGPACSGRGWMSILVGPKYPTHHLLVARYLLTYTSTWSTLEPAKARPHSPP